MADKGYVASLINALEASIKAPLKSTFDYVLDNLSFGAMDETRPKATNFRLYRFDATTSTLANEEFSVVHGSGQMPLNVFPVLPLNNVGSQIVRLQVTRAPDTQRVYLSSPDTNASISVMVEL